MREHLLCCDTEATELSSEIDALGGPEVGGSIEPASDGLPGKLPAAGKSAGKALLEVGLDVQAA